MSAEELRNQAEQLAGATARIEEIVAAWSTRTFTGSADSGGVVATVDAAGGLLSVDISVVSKRRHDGVTLGDAIVAAVRAAENAAAESQDAMTRELNTATGERLGALLDDARRAFHDRAGPRPPA
ncbi:YbaB/EbfC family nucleoid-associated protein [Nonomuraea ceibae]|uniref:YbaB/EbfC family nucleoid-associated protein n=1 Tax=Nonomuraea ceibae TaxID=1935170 RepID=UPI001C5FA147|nr:YbaB/EbfC family nucleoid-associated protein [Nonomuraea ceibae]